MSTASGDEYLVATEAPALVTVPERRVTQWPFIMVILVGVTGLGLIALGRLQEGIVGLVIAMGLAATLRMVLPTRVAGWLASRSRTVDVGAFVALAAGLAATLYLLK